MVRELLQLNTFHKKAITALFGVLVMLLFAYGLLMSRVILQVMARNDIERSIAGATADIAFLESEYMKMADSLTLARAHELGFVDTHVSLFVSRRADAFSFRTNAE
ncbi:MAG: hypothetical protein AMXMBFR44_3240 [Candidatus Campbellbacteria bacterium]